MHVHEIELKEFCQHGSLLFRPAAGVNGVLGRVGAGKSNFLRALRGAFTGDFGNFDGTKAQNVRSLKWPDDPSWIRIQGEHGGVQLEFTRHLYPEATKDVLRASCEEKPILGYKKVNAWLEGFFDTSMELVDRYVFIRQKAISDFLKDSATQRASAFAKLVGLDVLEKIRETITKKMSALPKLQEGIEQQIAETREKLNQERAKLSGLEVDKAKYGTHNYDNEIREIQRRMERHQEAAAVSGKLGLLATQILNLAARRGEVSTAQQTLVMQIPDQATVQAWHNELNGLNEKQAALKAWTKWLAEVTRARDVHARREKEMLEKQALLGEALGYDPYTRISQGWENHKADLESAITAAYESLGRATAEYAHFQSHQRLVGSLKNGACPHCLQPLPSHVRQKMFDGGGLLVQRTQAEEGVRLAKLKQEKFLRLEQDWEEAGRLLNQAGQQLALLGGYGGADALTDPGYADADLAATKRDLEAKFQDYFQKTNQFQALASDLQNLTNQSGQVAKEYEEKQEFCRKHLMTPAEKDEAEGELLRQHTCRQLLGELQAQIASSTRVIEIWAKELAGLEKKVADSEKQRLVQEAMVEVKRVLHPTELPQKVVWQFLNQLLPETNSLLASFGAEFQLEVGQDLNLIAHFPDGNVQPDLRMSEGQKTWIALAFLIAVNAEKAGTLGVLCLDEPTADLPSYEAGCLEQAIGRLQELGVQNGLQVFITTHEKALDKMFNATLRLE